MALLFLDGCQHLSTQQIVTKYDLLSNYVSGDVTAVLSVTRLGDTATVYKKLHTFANTGIFGVQFSAAGVQSYVAAGVNQLFTTAAINGNKVAVLEFRDTDGQAVARLAGSSGQVVLDIGSAYASVGTAAVGNVASIWNLWELEVSYGATGGARVYLSGVEVLSYTGSVLTSAATGITQAYWSWLRLATLQNGHIHDFYVLNNAGPQPSALPGPTARIRTHFANADTATSAWTPNSAGTHYTQLNEGSAGVGHDGGATYVSASTAGALDFVGIDSATGVYSSSEIPLGLQITALAIAAGGSPVLNLQLELSGTIVSHTAACAVSSDYFSHRAIFTSMPGGGSITVARVDALTIGIGHP